MILFAESQVLDVRAVTFGLSGTLYPLACHPFRRARFYARHHRFLSSFRDVREELRERGRVGDFDLQLIRGLSSVLGVSPQEAAIRFHDVIGREWLETLRGVRIYPGVRPFLEELVAQGVLLGIISDAYGRERLEHLGLSDFPWQIITAPEATGALKPHPAAFQVAREQLQVPSGKILHIGSRMDLDVIGAHRAGFNCALKRPGLVGLVSRSMIHRSPRMPPRVVLPRDEARPSWAEREDVPEFTFASFYELLGRVAGPR
mgnify:CR=1 FL=1